MLHIKLAIGRFCGAQFNNFHFTAAVDTAAVAASVARSKSSSYSTTSMGGIDKV